MEPNWKLGDLALPPNKVTATQYEKLVYEKAAIGVINALVVDANKNALLPVEMRQRDQPNADVLAKFDVYGPSIVLSGLTDLVKQVTDESTLNCLKGKFKNKIRKFFERSTPPTQCYNTVGRFEAGKSKCWICGFVIPKIDDVNENDEDEDEETSAHPLKPECEHVFPVAQALCFTGLFESQLLSQLKDESPNTAAAYVSGIQVEYQWAHRVCNQIKNDTHFISIMPGPESKMVYTVDTGKIQQLLTDIITTPKWGIPGQASGGQVLRELIGIDRGSPVERNNWLNECVKQIHGRTTMILDKVKNMGITVEDHAKNTIMDMRAYIAMNPDCTVTVEDIPKPVLVARSTINPAGLADVTSESAIKTVDGVLSFLVRIMLCGIFTQALEEPGAGGRRLLPAPQRCVFKARVLTLGEEFLKYIKSIFPDIKTLRRKILVTVSNSPGGELTISRPIYRKTQDENGDTVHFETGKFETESIIVNENVVWSYFQTWMVGMISAQSIIIVRNGFKEYLNNIQSLYMTTGGDPVLFQDFSFRFEQKFNDYFITKQGQIKHMLNGSSYEQIVATNVEGLTDEMISSKFKWWKAGRRRSRKRHSRKQKKRKTYRRKRLF
jgi:hypothetical protein